MDLRTRIRRAIDCLRDQLASDPTGRDPIDHPDIRRMNLIQLADLPFEPYVRGGDQVTGRQGRAIRSMVARSEFAIRTGALLASTGDFQPDSA